ncbi:hypothetical protein V6N12_017087 [Hibiscus sabdariffa]|uniref:RNase H type-1 domain-containing protein n=1 Tax=Hibiscus sabdariffa TaxID=183260 RepID=A0ABR1ZFK7_9ROSI
MKVVVPESLKSFLVLWNNLSIKPSLKPLWNLAFCGIVWTIWLRYKMGSQIGFDCLIDLSLLKIGAELAAIMEAIKVFKLSRWVKIYKLIIESDSLLSVSWIENPRTAPSNFAETVSKCATLCTPFSWEVRFVFRERNVDAHSLAQAGVGRQIPFVWFAPVG